jgi:hypothetical protein
LSTWEGRAVSLVTQYFSFFVQLGVAGPRTSTAASNLWDVLRDMEMTRSALGRRPCEGPRRCRDWEACDGAREACGPGCANGAELSIADERRGWGECDERGEERVRPHSAQWPGVSCGLRGELLCFGESRSRRRANRPFKPRAIMTICNEHFISP